MNWTYADFTLVGGNQPDETLILPALDDAAGNVALRHVLNISDPAMLVESAFDRFYETTDDVTNPLSLSPMTENDRKITYVLDYTQIGHIRSKVIQQAVPGNGHWFSRQNLADGPWGDGTFWIGQQGFDWEAVLGDFTFGGTDYYGLLDVCCGTLDYGLTIWPGCPPIQISGNAEEDKDIRAMYYAMAMMKTRFFDWGFDAASTTYQHTSQTFPIAEEGHLYSWATNKTPTSYISDVCTPTSTPLHTLHGAIRANAFENIQALMTFETKTTITYTSQGKTFQLVLFHTYNDIQTNGVQFRMDLGESSVFPPLLQTARLKQEVIGGTGEQKISHALNTELTQAGWGTVNEDWSGPVDPSSLTPSAV